MGLISDVRRGLADPLLEDVAAAEGVGVERLAEGVLDGSIVVVRNVLRRSRFRGLAIGAGLRTKVNANIGTSQVASCEGEEIVKLEAALAAGADSVMDLSTGGDIPAMRKAIVDRCDRAVGTVPVYEAAAAAQRDHGSVCAMSAREMIEAVRRHAEDGVDFMTIHAALTMELAGQAACSDRATGIVSRGGAIIAAWMAANDAENPFFEHFDEVLEICAAYDVVVSIGDSLRPGCLADAGDACQMAELALIGKLVLRARDAGVQVIVEGPGHVPLNEVASQIREAKRLCHGAPLYVLGPLVTDIAPGYDHITSAIGGAVAAFAGADFLCYVTPAEHVCLPDARDVAEGVVAARIAAHAGDVAKGIPGARDDDDRMARARKALDWEAQFRAALEPERPRSLREARSVLSERECSMCGSLCALRLTDEVGRQ